MSNNGVTLNSGLGFIQRHWKWHQSIEHIWLPITLLLKL